jgi:hypothetical protein
MLTYRVGEVNSPISGTCCFILRRGVSTLTNPFTRGSAPDRARSADLRPGSFKPGHEKRGGRKRGTPNLFTIDYKKAILEAASRKRREWQGWRCRLFFVGRRTSPDDLLYRAACQPTAVGNCRQHHVRGAPSDVGRKQPMGSRVYWAYRQEADEGANCSG